MATSKHLVSVLNETGSLDLLYTIILPSDDPMDPITSGDCKSERAYWEVLDEKFYLF